MSSEELNVIKKCQNGDLACFGFLYDLYIDKIYKFVYYKTHQKENAEDITSRIFMKALENISSFDVEKGTFQSWIYQIARNCVIDFYRAAKNDANIDDVWDLNDGSCLEKETDIKLKLQKVEKYLQKMKSEHRDIIIMRIWQGLSYKEIAEIMGKSEAASKMMYSRAINSLRQELPVSLILYFIYCGYFAA
jgi:RNA polymerase sigma-70 factor, ECF subfamily